MDFIEKLFKQHPFIYKISGKYYAFGNGVCIQCSTRSVFLERKYNHYVESISEDLQVDEAWKIFHAVNSEAKFSNDENEICFNPRERLADFHFNKDELEELERQVNQYVDYWKKYSFHNYLH